MRDLVADYGCKIDSYLRKIEKDSSLKSDHLSNHELKANFRSRMVDWMVEVMNIAFSNICGDQTLFLAVSILDRYIQALEQRGEVFKASDLHTTGVTCMFIASKYEDVQPLLLKTVFNKIGHTKIPTEVIIAKEL
jgi:cyclin B/cyclin A